MPIDKQVRCGAKTRKGTPCQGLARANGRCRMHGGNARAGIASPTYRHGKLSKALPQRLREAYVEALDDPTLLHQREQLALLDSRLLDVLARVDSGESGALWRELKQRRVELRDAQRAQDSAAQIAALNALLSLIDAGHADYRAWMEVRDVVEQRKRIVESERRRLVEMQHMISQAQAMALLTALIDAVRTHVHDADTLVAVQSTFDRLIGPLVERALDDAAD